MARLGVVGFSQRGVGIDARYLFVKTDCGGAFFFIDIELQDGGVYAARRWSLGARR